MFERYRDFLFFSLKSITQCDNGLRDSSDDGLTVKPWPYKLEPIR